MELSAFGWDAMEPAEMASWARRAQDCALWTECFYYLAWRFCCLLGAKPPDGLGLNLEVGGIRIVRNHLLEHPEDLLYRDFNLAKPNEGGPKFVPRGGSDRFVDSGLYANAGELVAETEQALKREIARLPTVTPPRPPPL
jgi:hypothetical protein